MTDTNSVFSFANLRSDAPTPTEQSGANRHTLQALERHKQQGLEMAMRARWVSLGIVAVMLPFLNPRWEVLYHVALLGVLAFIGWLQRRVGRVGLSRMELGVLFLDLSIATFILVFPNPFSDRGWPDAGVFQFGGFIYFFLILAVGTLAYSWRTITAIGTWTAAIWSLAVLAIWLFGRTDPTITQTLQAAFPEDLELARLLDPNSLNLDLRAQEIVVFVLVAFTLAITVRRYNILLLGTAEVERERENLSRYFSPNVVEELSRKDDPLKQIRTHDVAVLFIDIVGFTEYAARRPPPEVIETLRGFHALMEAEVFNHGGTLDKYLGDGLMATFGTPEPTELDAINALRCGRSMLRVLAEWNRDRKARGEPEIRGSVGLHYGPVVLGDIGANRLEFAVIGNTVNVASRLESLTRVLSVDLAISDRLREIALDQGPSEDPALKGLDQQVPQTIRGLDAPLPVWTLRENA